MKLLLKCPTRSRPQKVLSVLRQYVAMANRPDLIGVCVSADTDDESMKQTLVQEELHRILSPCAWHRIFYSENKSKIQAVNANMGDIAYDWDIVLLVSDDMIPQVKGYDDIIRSYMMASFPNTDGILWTRDEFQGTNLNTLSILGKKMYESFGYLYHPAYISFFCDTEFTDLCKTTLKDKCVYLPYQIIRHEHPGNVGTPPDALYHRNQMYFSYDMQTYISRKTYSYDWSILIATIQGREHQLKSLLELIHEKKNRLCPDIRIEIRLSYDNREKSIGLKRHDLLQGANGKYMSFIDDDDAITDAYIEDAVGCILGNYHVSRLRGQINQYTFTHSVENKLTDPMARDGVFVRPPNHLNVMMTDAAKFIKFNDATRGEDLDWTMRLARTNFLQKEYRSEPSRIHYIYNMGIRVVDPSDMDSQSHTTYEAMLKKVWIPVGSSAHSVASTKQSALRLGPKGFVSK